MGMRKRTDHPLVIKKKKKKKKKEKMEDFGPVCSGVIFLIFFL